MISGPEGRVLRRLLHLRHPVPLRLPERGAKVNLCDGRWRHPLATPTCTIAARFVVSLSSVRGRGPSEKLARKASITCCRY